MFQLNGLPSREIDGLPFTVHQMSENAWQIVIQNCSRHPAGYTFNKVYNSLDDAVGALEDWPEAHTLSGFAGDDTGAAKFAAELAYFED